MKQVGERERYDAGSEMLDTQNYLMLVRRRGEAGLELSRVYRNMRRKELFLLADSNLYANKGATTPGIDPQDTIDGMSLERIDAVIDQLANGTYTWTPVRRTYIEKKHSSKMRPLGIPGWNDKMVQEVMKLILESYYEPQFRDCSHGFRPKRGCHTALQDVYRTWHGTKWFIELDITGCFDNISHKVLIEILQRKINDDRFLALLRNMLEAGYMEKWGYHKTYSGTPQGGIVSPVLANIVLNELDIFIEDTLIPEYTAGKRRRKNPEYGRLNQMTFRAKKKGDRKTYKDCLKKKKALPSLMTHDPNYKRLRYVRYADDSLMGWTGTKAEAEAIKDRTGNFLLEKLSLEMSSEKTFITHAKEEHARFLNYNIGVSWNNTAQTKVSGSTRRSVNGQIRLEVPNDVIRNWNSRIQSGHTTKHRKELMNNSDYDIVMTYEQQIRGLINYYTLAHDVVRKMNKIRYAYEQSLVKTLAAKHNTSVAQIYRKYRGYTTKGKRVIMVKVARKEKPPLIASYGKIAIRQNRHTAIQDEKPTPLTHRTELLQRLLNNQCELCGTYGEVAGHHIRKLKDLKKRGRELLGWQKRMIALRRKTLFVCKECHNKIHSGTYDGQKLT